LRINLTYLFITISLPILSQRGLYVNGAAASLRADTNSFISVQGDFQNLNCDPLKQVRFNGTLYLSGNLVNNDSLKFDAVSSLSKKSRIIFNYSNVFPTGGSVTVSGSAAPHFWEVLIDKGASGILTLNANVYSKDTVEFNSGNISMNGYKWNLLDPVGVPLIINHPYLKKERFGSQFVAASINDTGFVTYQTIYTSSINLNPANIGVEITGLVNIGSPFNVYRGFKPQVNAAKGGILRFFDIYSQGHSLVNNGIKVKYSTADLSYFPLNYFTLPDLNLYASSNTDVNWSGFPTAVQNTLVSTVGPVNNGAISASLIDLIHPNTNIDPHSFRVTIADPNCLNPPVSALAIDTVHICTGNTMLLDAGNVGQVANASLKWEWQTNPPAYTRTLLIAPNTSFQKFKVILKDVKGCITQDSVILAPQAPFPVITYFNHLNSCLGDSVTIKDSVKIAIGFYTNTWSFSDGSSSQTLSNLFKKKFQGTGNHSILLTSTSNFGCTVSATSTNITVYPLPQASFTQSLNCNTQITSFNNTSVSNYSTLTIASNLWRFGTSAGNTSTLQSPAYLYTVSGTYSVTLTTSSSFGCVDSVSIPVVIYPANHAAFTKNNACLNDTVFLGNQSSCSTGSCSYLWSFGDSNYSSTLSPKKVYASPGLYSVKLKVINPVGCPDSTTSDVFVNHAVSCQFTTTNTDICPDNYIYFTNTSTITSGLISTNAWSYGNSTFSGGLNGSAIFSNSGSYMISLTAQSDSGCTSSHTLVITVRAQPLAQFYVNDVCLGGGSNFISTSAGYGSVYKWDFGNSVSTNTLISNTVTYTYAAPGNYPTSLIVFNSWGCSDTSYATTQVIPRPVIALGGSVSTCGTAYTLNAGNPGASYYWQPGNQSTQIIQVTANGLYHVSITGTNGCQTTESVQVTLNSIVTPVLGQDTSFCGTYILNAGYPGSAFLWNTSATTQSINVNTSGTYAVHVTDVNGCTGRDTVNVAIKPPAYVYLGNDLTACLPKSGIVLTPTTNGISFYWSNGKTSLTDTIKSSGNYIVEAVAANGCSAKDTISLIFLQTPVVDLGPDKKSCGYIDLDAHNNGCTFLWNTGATSPTIHATQSALFAVRVTDTITGCYGQDSINLVLHPSVPVDLGRDTSVCSNSHTVLDAGNGAAYRWLGGATSKTIGITSPGIYGVTVTSTEGCIATDFITLTVTPSPEFDLGEHIRYLCGTTGINLQGPSTGIKEWYFESTVISAASEIYITQPGKYRLRVASSGCSSSDSIITVLTSNTIQALFLASTHDTINTPVQFINLTEPAPISQVWSFGDGLTSTESNPVHLYVSPQDFSVTLQVSNGYCTDKLTKSLHLLFRQTIPSLHPVEKLVFTDFNFYPNPAEVYIHFNVELNDPAPLTYYLADVAGRTIIAEKTPAANQFDKALDIRQVANGIYFLTIIAESLKGNIIKTTKFIKIN
jgi:PKD repeat protein